MKKNELLLMSIKTKYAKEIFDGTKRYEFRRKSIGDNNCHKRIYIYSSGEEKAIIGYMVVDGIISGSLEDILVETKTPNSEEMIDYYRGVSVCYALHIGEYHKFIKPIKLTDIKEIDREFVAPQFYRYIKADEVLYKLLREMIYDS